MSAAGAALQQGSYPPKQWVQLTGRTLPTVRRGLPYLILSTPGQTFSWKIGKWPGDGVSS
jgi:hypothetical protein